MCALLLIFVLSALVNCATQLAEHKTFSIKEKHTIIVSELNYTVLPCVMLFYVSNQCVAFVVVKCEKCQ